jgi:hypothetical protein
VVFSVAVDTAEHFEGGDHMGIFDRLKNAILGTKLHAGPVETGRPTTASSPPAPASQASAQAPRPTPSQAAPVVAPNAQVDIEAVLVQMAAKQHEKLNWQTSIVDLMKLVDLDPSLENRKTLANELGYTGNTQDTASMNIWLHKEVMQKLAASGGKVPDSLRH